MIVTRTNYDDCLMKIGSYPRLSLDTETTGLFPYHGDKLFSIIVGTPHEQFYFNWNEYQNLPQDMLLTQQHMDDFGHFTDNHKKHWFLHNALYDLPILRNDHIDLWGVIHCTKTIARVEFNEYNSYTLEDCGKRIKFPKDMTVEEYIKKHKLVTIRERGGRKYKAKRFDLVPFEIITKYGMRDAKVTYELGISQLASIERKDTVQRSNKNLKNTIMNVFKNELSLQETLFRMQNVGAKIDKQFCIEAVENNNRVMDDSIKKFEELTGMQFVLSGLVFEKVFEDQKEKWSYTEKGNPSFDADALAKLEGPVVEQILAYKKAKSEIDFFKGFLFFADSEDVIHTNFSSGGTRTGRFSSSGPNLQNLKKDKGVALEQGYVVRRAIVPRTGFFLAMLDYDQIEYRMMLDAAGAGRLIHKVLGGLDVHTATAENAGCTRDDAKTVNFLTLYGGGIKKLAQGLKTTEEKAKAIQQKIFDSAPEIKHLIRTIIKNAERKHVVTNWFGRLNHFPKRNIAYKAPNTIFQGGAGDVVKKAMVDVDRYLCRNLLQSRILLNIHDELIFEIADNEAHILPKIKGIMEQAYTPRYLPLTVGIEFSTKSLADKEPWQGIEFLHGKKTGDNIQGKNAPTVKVSPEVMDRENTASGASGYA